MESFAREGQPRGKPWPSCLLCVQLFWLFHSLPTHFCSVLLLLGISPGNCCIFQASQGWFGLRSQTNPTNSYHPVWLFQGSLFLEKPNFFLCVLIIWSSHCNFNISPSPTDMPSSWFTQVRFALHRGGNEKVMIIFQSHLQRRWHKILSDNYIWR